MRLYLSLFLYKPSVCASHYFRPFSGISPPVCICDKICLMQKTVKSPEVERARRTVRALAAHASTVQISRDTGIHQSQVSRLLRGQFKRVSGNVLLLVEYAKKSKGRKVRAAAGERRKAAVIKAALRTWDATPD